MEATLQKSPSTTLVYWAVRKPVIRKKKYDFLVPMQPPNNLLSRPPLWAFHPYFDIYLTRSSLFRWDLTQKTIHFTSALPSLVRSFSSVFPSTRSPPLSHPSHFYAVYQNSGDDNTNWGAFEKKRTLLGKSTIDNGDRCSISCDFWHLYKEDIDRAHTLGSNCFRLSLEWSRLQPDGPGTAFDRDAVATYHAIFDALEARNMEPFVTFHHFVHPLWFEKLGGFTKVENIPLFVEYSVAAYKEFGGRARFWTTFNEPGVTSFAGFIYGSFPPGRMARIAGCGQHILNMLRAHTDVYAAVKALPGGKEASIGLVHNWFWFEPKKSCCTPFYVNWVANVLNRMWGNEVVMNYLKTGVFDYNPLPFGICRVQYENPGGPPGCDHIGLNYYSRGLFDWKLQPCLNPGEVMTDMPYSLHAEGLLTAVAGVSQLGVPIYITETGVADDGDALRPQCIQSYMSAVEEAVRVGYDLRGVMYWTLVDNFEWAFGYRMKFGMYRWDPAEQGTPEYQERKLHKSGALLGMWYERLKDKCPGLRAEALKRGADGVLESRKQVEDGGVVKKELELSSVT